MLKSFVGIASAASGLCIIGAIVTVGYIFNDINNFYDDAIIELDSFKSLYEFTKNNINTYFKGWDLNLCNSNPVLLDKSNLALSSNLADSCPQGYAQPTGANWDYCYKVYPDLKTRSDAASRCAADNGTLASIPNAFTSAYLFTLANEDGASSIWLGTKCYGNGTCINDDGTKAAYSDWNPGQPSNSNECVYMSATGRDSQKWYTQDCSKTYAYACAQKTGGNVNPTTCPSNYTEFQGTCYSYQVSSEGFNRNEMSKKCKKEKGGNLATIASAQVNTFLMNIEKTGVPHDITDPSVVIGIRCPNVTSTGDTSSCMWDDGTPFSFSGFDSGEPSVNSDPESDCVDFETGKWKRDIQCNSYMYFYYFICQAPLQ